MCRMPSLHSYLYEWFEYNRYTSDFWEQDLFLKPSQVELVWDTLKSNNSGVTLALWVELFEPAGDVHVKIHSAGKWRGVDGPGILVMVPKKHTPVSVLSEISRDFGLPGFDTIDNYPPSSGDVDSGLTGFSWARYPASTTVVVDLVQYYAETGVEVRVEPGHIDEYWSSVKQKYGYEVWGVVVKWVYDTYNLISLIWCAYGDWKNYHSSEVSLSEDVKKSINDYIAGIVS